MIFFGNLANEDFQASPMESLILSLWLCITKRGLTLRGIITMAQDSRTRQQLPTHRQDKDSTERGLYFLFDTIFMYKLSHHCHFLSILHGSEMISQLLFVTRLWQNQTKILGRNRPLTPTFPSLSLFFPVKTNCF